MVIATAIITVLALLLNRMLVINYISYEKNKVKFELTDQAIKALDYITPEIRGATQILTCELNAISFYHIQGTATVPDKITIDLDINNQSIEHQFIAPSGTPPNITYDSAPTVKNISKNVVNDSTKPIYRYFDGDGAEIASPCDPNQVRLVSVDLRHQNVGRYAPINELVTQTKIQLRNLKDNL